VIGFGNTDYKQIARQRDSSAKIGRAADAVGELGDLAPIVTAASVAFKDIDRALFLDTGDVGRRRADGDGVASDATLLPNLS
jgi:hypothetical protein